MRFAYQRHWFPGHGKGAKRGFDIYRPEIFIRLRGPSGVERYRALVDTGSDLTIFPSSTADTLGVVKDKKLTRQVQSASGHAVEVRLGKVTLELEQRGNYYRWPTTIGFAPVVGSVHEGALLGHDGFLEYFTATFDGKKRELSLKPNSRLPRY